MQILRRYVLTLIPFPLQRLRMVCCGGMGWESYLRANVKDRTGGFFRAHLKFPAEYPLLPPKMKFESPIFHPNSPSRPTPRHFSPFSPCARSQTNEKLNKTISLPIRRSLHFNPTPTGRWRIRLRVSLGAMVARANPGNDLAERDFDVV